MTPWTSFGQKPYTLHSWLSLAELVLFPLSLAGLYGAISSWRKLHALNKDSAGPNSKNDSPITSAELGWNWWTLSTGWALWPRRLKGRFQMSQSPSGRAGNMQRLKMWITANERWAG